MAIEHDDDQIGVRDLLEASELSNADVDELIGDADTVVQDEPSTKEPDWKAAQDDLRKEIQGSLSGLQGQMQAFMAAMAARPAQAAAAPSPQQAGQLSEDERAQLWAAGVQNPQLMAQIFDAEVTRKVKEHEDQIERRVMNRITEQSTTTSLRDQALALYGEDIADQGSEIMRALPAVRDKFSPLLNPNLPPEARNQALLLLAAALNPTAVAKRARAREELQEKSRAEKVKRLSGMGMFGGRMQERTSEELTEDDRELMEIYGLNDEADGEYIRKAKKTEKMSFMNKGMLTGGNG